MITGIDLGCDKRYDSEEGTRIAFGGRTKTQSKLWSISIGDKRPRSPRYKSGRLSTLRKCRIKERFLLEKTSTADPRWMKVGRKESAPPKRIISWHKGELLSSKWAGIRSQVLHQPKKQSMTKMYKLRDGVGVSQSVGVYSYILIE